VLHRSRGLPHSGFSEVEERVSRAAALDPVREQGRRPWIRREVEELVPWRSTGSSTVRRPPPFLVPCSLPTPADSSPLLHRPELLLPPHTGRPSLSLAYCDGGAGRGGEDEQPSRRPLPRPTAAGAGGSRAAPSRFAGAPPSPSLRRSSPSTSLAPSSSLCSPDVLSLCRCGIWSRH
jgi:hypothetical protein